MKKRGQLLALVASVLLLTVAFTLYWAHQKPRRDALAELSHFAVSLNAPGPGLLDFVIMPAAVQTRTPAEQREFLLKALSDEISAEGVLALKGHAVFGPAKIVFPVEYAKWCQQAGVDADDCVAFKMERAGIRAEVLLVHQGQTYRVVRCKDVKQMAMNLNHG